jgi:hypothetical protein
MADSKFLRTMLSGGDRRSIGCANEVVDLVLVQPKRIAELVELIWDSSEVVRMRAADALEKISRERIDLLQTYRSELLGLMAETAQQELRWHLAAMIPRMELAPEECRRAAAVLELYLGDRSSIVKTFAMQGLWGLARKDATLRTRAVELVRELARTGTAAMRARGRKLLREIDGSGVQ